MFAVTGLKVGALQPTPEMMESIEKDKCGERKSNNA